MLLVGAMEPQTALYSAMLSFFSVGVADGPQTHKSIGCRVVIVTYRCFRHNRQRDRREWKNVLEKIGTTAIYVMPLDLSITVWYMISWSLIILHWSPVKVRLKKLELIISMVLEVPSVTWNTSKYKLLEWPHTHAVPEFINSIILMTHLRWMRALEYLLVTRGRYKGVN